MTPTRVLLADDFALFRRGLASLLGAEEDFEVVGEAVDGQEAVEMARELMPDLILMDISMPVLNGLEATRRIKAELPYAKIVILTVSDAEQSLFEAVKCGAQGYLLKEVEPQELYLTLRRIAQGEAPVSQVMAVRLLEEFGRPARAEAPSPAGLSAREREVLEHLARGASPEQAAAALGIAEAAVRNYLKNVLEKLHLENRAQDCPLDPLEGPFALPSRAAR